MEKNGLLKIKTWYQSHKLLTIGIMFACLIVFPFISTGMLIRTMSTVLIYCILSMGNMIISGHTGMLNMGHAAFYGVGAYVSAILSVEYQIPFFACFLLAGVVAGLCGFLISFPCLRVQTDFLSLITIAFANVFLTVALNWMDVTRGPMGIPGIPPAELFGIKFNTPVSFYFLLLSIVVAIYILLRNIIESKIGRAFQATRDNEIGARSVGINIKKQKILAFTIGTFTAGLAGSLMVHYIGFVGPNNFSFDESLLIMQMCIIGGLGSMPGSIIGAAFLVIMPEIIRPLAVYRIGIGGLIMILCMIYRPQGILGSRAFASSDGFQDKLRQRMLKLRSMNARKSGSKA